ncbi:hypothetical protein Nmel_012583 [Mimus melanotis]
MTHSRKQPAKKTLRSEGSKKRLHTACCEMPARHIENTNKFFLMFSSNKDLRDYL